MVHFHGVHGHEKHWYVNDKNPKMPFGNENVLLYKKGHNTERYHKRCSNAEQIKKDLRYIRKSLAVRTVHPQLPPGAKVICFPHDVKPKL